MGSPLAGCSWIRSGQSLAMIVVANSAVCALRFSWLSVVPLGFSFLSTEVSNGGELGTNATTSREVVLRQNGAKSLLRNLQASEISFCGARVPIYRLVSHPLSAE